MDNKLSFYSHKFTHLRTDRTGGWSSSTKGQAPHKPFLLLAVLDLFAQGHVHANLIEITPELGESFASYWSTVMPPERRGNLALPFFHLRSSYFWHLLPQPGQEETLKTIREVDSLRQLGKLVLGACLDDDLYQLLQTAEPRNLLRTVLIETYFASEYHEKIQKQAQMSFQASVYSQKLVEQARKQAKEQPGENDVYLPAVRDQGFRRAIVRIYDHRCAFCGVRMLTSDGRTAVDAAHIIPWSISHNDDPHNGMAMCGLCHWSFDQGLLGISKKYLVQLSSELRITQNVPGHLLTLEGRLIIGPNDQALWPDAEAINWHLNNTFRKK